MQKYQGRLFGASIQKCNKGRKESEKAPPTVGYVIHGSRLTLLGLGHVRYRTAGSHTGVGIGIG